MITEVKCTCPACPVQYEGKLGDGKYFYFRSRWEAWEFGIGDTHDAAVTHAMQIAPDGFARTGETDAGAFSASWMEHDEAERIIRQCVDEYVASTAQEISPKPPDQGA